MSSAETTKIETFDRYIMKGGELTLDQIEILVKENLGLGKLPSDIPPQEIFDEFMTLVIENLTEQANVK